MPARGPSEVSGLLISRALSMVGDQTARVALSVLVFRDTHSAGLTALTYALTLLPVLVSGLLLGGLADRVPRRALLVVSDLARALLVAAMCLPRVPLAVLDVLVVGVSLIDGPWLAARGAVLRSLAADGDTQRYQRLAGLDEGLNQIGQVAGFAVAGALVATLGVRPALGLDAASFLASAAVVRLWLRAQPAAVAGPAAMATGVAALRTAARTVRTDLAAGWQAVRVPARLRVVSAAWVAVAAAIAPEGLAAAWASSLHVGGTAVGFLLAANPLGAIAGLAVLTRRPARISPAWTLPLLVLSTAVLLPAWWHPGLPVCLVLLAVSGFGLTGTTLARVTFAATLPDEVRGRAFAVASTGLSASQAVGLLVTGVVASTLGAPRAVALAGAVGTVGLLTLTLRYRAETGSGGSSELPPPTDNTPSSATPYA